MQNAGLRREVVDVARMIEIEPALAASADDIVGGTYTESDESGDAHKFTQALAAVCRARGVRFVFGTEVTALRAAGGRLTGVETKTLATGFYETLSARAVVVLCFTAFMLACAWALRREPWAVSLGALFLTVEL